MQAGAHLFQGSCLHAQVWYAHLARHLPRRVSGVDGRSEGGPSDDDEVHRVALSAMPPPAAPEVVGGLRSGDCAFIATLFPVPSPRRLLVPVIPRVRAPPPLSL